MFNYSYIILAYKLNFTNYTENTTLTSIEVYHGSSVTLTATAASGNTFSSWSQISGGPNCTASDLSSSSITVSNVSGDCGYTAMYTKEEVKETTKVTFWVNNPSFGTGTIDGQTTTSTNNSTNPISKTYTTGAVASVSASANSTYEYEKMQVMSGSCKFSNGTNTTEKSSDTLTTSGSSCQVAVLVYKTYDECIFTAEITVSGNAQCYQEDHGWAEGENPGDYWQIQDSHTYEATYEGYCPTDFSCADEQERECDDAIRDMTPDDRAAFNYLFDSCRNIINGGISSYEIYEPIVKIISVQKK